MTYLLQNYLAEKAVAAANNLGFKEKTIIYFAVDYDFTYDQMLKKVVPYFKEIKKYFARRRNPTLKISLSSALVNAFEVVDPTVPVK